MDPARYVNQKKQIKNGEAFCGAASVAMITGEDPQDVADTIGDTAADDVLTKYLVGKGFKPAKIVDGGTQASRWAFMPSIKDFAKMREAIDAGAIILYHFAGWDKKSTGHYALCKGYTDSGFIFNDPAGNRNQGYFNDHGEGATYTMAQLQAAGIKRLFSITGGEA